MALAALWFLYGLKNTIVVTTAPTWTLVEEQLWREIRGIWKASITPLKGRLLDTQIDIEEKWFALGLSTDEYARFTGFHSARVLIIIDEATGVREELWDAAESMVLRKGDRIVAIGNPTDPASRFKRSCDSGRYNVIPLSCLDHPNVVHDNEEIVPGAVTKGWCEDQLLAYGSKDSPLYKAKVLGQWPSSRPDALIPYDVLVRAQGFWERNLRRRDGKILKAGKSLGLDISGLGDDLSVLTECDDGQFKILWWHRHKETMETVGRVLHSIRAGSGDYRALAIDDTGIGNGVSSRILELQQWARKKVDTVQTPNSFFDPTPVPGSDPLLSCVILRVNFAQKSREPEKYHSIKDEMWWHLREGLIADLHGLPTDHQFSLLQAPKGMTLLGQLEKPIYEMDSSGRIRVLDKKTTNSEKQKLLPTKSPDFAHSTILCGHAWRVIRPREAQKEVAKHESDVARLHFKEQLEKDKKKHSEKFEPHDYSEDYAYLNEDF